MYAAGSKEKKEEKKGWERRTKRRAQGGDGEGDGWQPWRKYKKDNVAEKEERKAAER